MIILLFWLFPMTFLGIFLAIFIATRKNLKKKFLIFFVFCFIPSYLSGFGYISEKAFLILGLISVLIATYLLVKIDE